jgi:hypothetical protein
MLHEQQKVSDAAALTLFDERSLESQRLSVGCAAESPDLDTSGHLVIWSSGHLVIGWSG